MLCFIRQDPRRLANSIPQPGRERLGHLVIGSPGGIRATIHQLQVLNYADQTTWSQRVQAC